jgi:hypothetical protein
MDQSRRLYFGRGLRELRESFVRRLSSGGEDVPYVRATVSASALIDCMKKEQGFSISSAAYNEIENGLNVPRDATGFLDAVATCLRLTEDEKRDLSKRLAYDLVWARLGDGRTDEIIPPSPHWRRPTP